MEHFGTVRPKSPWPTILAERHTAPDPTHGAMSMIEKHDVPLDPPLAHELVDFWTYIWNEPPDVPIDVFLGAEVEHVDLTVLFERGSVGVTSTCMIVSPRAIPTIADLGAVATHPDLRNRGLSTRVCGTAVDLAFERGCEALFVGTGGGAAARVYERLGFRKLPGANWWIAVANGEPPEAFVVDYFRRPAASVTVRPASPADRIPMIPLIVSPHRWRLLDANARIFSTAYATTGSFTQYMRYTKTVTAAGGSWSTAVTDDGRAVGLATARPAGSDTWRVDAFTQSRFTDAWPELMEAAVGTAAAGGAKSCRIDVSSWDDEKAALAESAGFRHAGSGDPVDLAGSELQTTRLERQV